MLIPAQFYVDFIFADPSKFSGSVLLLGLIYFAFQIYCDFSGYSSIAIGTAKLLGFSLMTNFRFPYFSRNIMEFWSRWHISLSTWFRDYVYIPLGGSRCGKYLHLRNILLTFGLSGLWHGANWTFLIWGILNGIYYIPYIFFKKDKFPQVVAYKTFLPSIKESLQIVTTFFLVLISWTFFRAESIGHAWLYLGQMMDPSLLSIPNAFRGALIAIIFLVGVEWLQRDKEYVLQFDSAPWVFRWGTYMGLAIFTLGMFKADQQFIYFQF